MLQIALFSCYVAVFLVFANHLVKQQTIKSKKNNPKLSRWYKSTAVKQRLKLLDMLYRDVDGRATALAARDNNTKFQQEQFTYGEIIFVPFIALLELCQPIANEVYYDLGSGAGKSIFTAALFFEFKKLIGVEIIPELHQLSEKVLHKFENQIATIQEFAHKKNTIHFLQQDLLNSDLTDADIVFINGTCFVGEHWDKIQQKLDFLKVGSRVMLTTKKLTSEKFTLQIFRICSMSWGDASVSIYQKVD